MRGIDVSENNGQIDWQAVAAAGIEFAIIRSSYGLHSVDGNFADNLQAAQQAGLKVGVYHYSYALTVDEARQEAERVIELLQEHGINPELGIWYDMEDADGYKERHGMPDNDTITAMCSAFICELNEAGYQYVGIYASYWWLTGVIDTSQLADYVPYWVAQWGGSNDFPRARMWQYTDCLNIGERLFDGDIYYD